VAPRIHFLASCFPLREGGDIFTFLNLDFFSVTLILGFSENFSLAIVLSVFSIVITLVDPSKTTKRSARANFRLASQRTIAPGRHFYSPVLP
jgi:hypothetical protein